MKETLSYINLWAKLLNDSENVENKAFLGSMKIRISLKDGRVYPEFEDYSSLKKGMRC